MADYPDGYFRGARKLSQPDELERFVLDVITDTSTGYPIQLILVNRTLDLEALINKKVVAGKIEELERFKKSPYWPKIWLEVKNRLKELGADDE